MRYSKILMFFLLVGCTASQPPRPAPPARFDIVRGDECVRDDIRRRLVDLGDRVLAVTREQEGRMVEEALDGCGFQPGFDRHLAVQRLSLAAASMRFEISRPYREQQNEVAARDNAVRDARRRTEIDEASRRYLLCVQAAAASLATSSTEAATVIADAATGSCPTEAAALSRADWQMKAALDAHHRAPLLAQILRVRKQQSLQQRVQPPSSSVGL